MHLLQDLRRRPVCKYAEEAWKIMSENFEARVITPLGQGGDSPFLNIFAEIVLPAWETREVVSGKSGELSMPPRIVSFVKDNMARKAQNVQRADKEQEQPVTGMSMDDLPMSMPMGFGDYGFGLLYGAGGHDNFDIPEHHLNWAVMDWGFGELPI